MIQIENTPNPNSLKFISEKIISSVGTKEFQKVNVSKIEQSNWDSLKPSIISSLNDYFENNELPILSKDISAKSKVDQKDNETVSQIKDVLDNKIRPAVAKDGGDIKFISFENGVVKVKLQGSCSGCPSSLMTLKQGVQNLLKHYVKEVNSVEAQ